MVNLKDMKIINSPHRLNNSASVEDSVNVITPQKLDVHEVIKVIDNNVLEITQHEVSTPDINSA